MSDEAIEVDEICSNGMPSAGRDVCNGESTLSNGVMGCEQLLLAGGGTHGIMQRASSCHFLRALLRHLFS